MAKLRDFDRRNMVGRYPDRDLPVAGQQAVARVVRHRQPLVDLIRRRGFSPQLRSWHSDLNDPNNWASLAMSQYRTRLFGTTDTQAQPGQVGGRSPQPRADPS